MTRETIYDAVHPVWNGTQKVVAFDNGYAASVIQATLGFGGGSYGAEEGLYELGVLYNPEPFAPWGDRKWGLVYDTPITNDVIGYLAEEDVDELLDQIEALPPRA